MDIVGLFALSAATMGLMIANRSRAALLLFALTLALTALTLWRNMTDTLAISL